MFIEYRPTASEIESIHSALQLYGKQRYHVSGITVAAYVALPRLLLDLTPLPMTYQDGREEYIDIDAVLGYYDHNQQAIILRQAGLKYAIERLKAHSQTKSLSLPAEDEILPILRLIVLIHEFGHWAMHKLRRDDSVFWAEEDYTATDPEFHEVWAQLLVHYALTSNEADKARALVFEALLNQQSPKYQEYKNYLGEAHSFDLLCDRLEKLKSENRPGKLTDLK